MPLWSVTCQQSVFKRYHSDKHFSEFLPTRWRQKSTGIDIEQNYVTVTLSIYNLPFLVMSRSSDVFCRHFACHYHSTKRTALLLPSNHSNGGDRKHRCCMIPTPLPCGIGCFRQARRLDEFIGQGVPCTSLSKDFNFRGKSDVWTQLKNGLLAQTSLPPQKHRAHRFNGFSRLTRVRNTDRHRDHATCNICSNRPHPRNACDAT